MSATETRRLIGEFKGREADEWMDVTAVNSSDGEEYEVLVSGRNKNVDEFLTFCVERGFEFEQGKQVSPQLCLRFVWIRFGVWQNRGFG